MRISTGVQTCALPICERPPQPANIAVNRSPPHIRLLWPGRLHQLLAYRTIATGSSIPDRRGGRSGGPLDHSRARRPLRLRFFDGGGHLIVTQLRAYSRPNAVVVLAPIRSPCGGAVGCRSRGGLSRSGERRVGKESVTT